MLSGIDKTEIPVPFAIWPNPANHYITIVNQQNDSKSLYYSVYDIAGKQLLKGSISESLTTTVDVSMLKAGIYVLRINGKKSVFSARVVIR